MRRGDKVARVVRAVRRGLHAHLSQEAVGLDQCAQDYHHGEHGGKS